jgi:predicted GNAT family N-acyltransferase
MIAVAKIHNSRDMEAAFAVREKVFVEEQHVPRLEEYDEFEKSSEHYLATLEDVPCGAARWRRTNKGIKLERFAVLPEFRCRGVGSRLVTKVLADARKAHPDLPVYLHAQVTAVPFYKKHGFEAEGERFSEANIDHFKMFYSGRTS